MAESTLALTFNDLQAEVGLFLGWGRGVLNGDVAWDSYKQATLTSIVNSGYHQFLFPPPIEGMESAYDWSFLRPVGSVTLPNAAATVTLPDDFGGFEGQITLGGTVTLALAPIQLVNEGRIRELFQVTPTATGRPSLAAVRPLKGSTAVSGQRQELFVYPIADAAYVLNFQYYVAADAMTTNYPYPLGGMMHRETILESCLAIAEQRLDDASTVHSMKFKERLLASISLDRRNKPQVLGYNRDNSDYLHRRHDRGDLHWMGTGVLINGIQYAFLLTSLLWHLGQTGMT